MPTVYQKTKETDDLVPSNLQEGSIVKFEDGTLYEVNSQGKLVPPAEA